LTHLEIESGRVAIAVVINIIFIKTSELATIKIVLLSMTAFCDELCGSRNSPASKILQMSSKYRKIDNKALVDTCKIGHILSLLYPKQLERESSLTSWKTLFTLDFTITMAEYDFCAYDYSTISVPACVRALSTLTSRIAVDSE